MVMSEDHTAYFTDATDNSAATRLCWISNKMTDVGVDMSRLPVPA